MPEGFIQSHIKRTNRNFILTNIIILAVTVLIAAGSHRYLYNFFNGPFETDLETISSMANPSNSLKYYFSIKGEKSYQTGLQHIVKRYDKYTKKVKSETIESDYLYLQLKKKLLVIKVPHGREGTQFSGTLEIMPSDVEHELKNIEKEDNNRPEADFKKHVLPVMMDASDFKLAGYIGIAVCSILILIALFNIIRFIKRSQDHKLHPIYKSLSKFGNPEILISNINNELKLKAETQAGKLILTDSWLFIPTVYTLKPALLNYVVWVYKKITQRRVNFIPTGKTFSIVIYLKDKSELSAQMNEGLVNQAIVQIQAKIPWVIAGYSDEVQRLWNKNFPEFLAAVEQRKAEKTES